MNHLYTKKRTTCKGLQQDKPQPHKNLICPMCAGRNFHTSVVTGDLLCKKCKRRVKYADLRGAVEPYVAPNPLGDNVHKGYSSYLSENVKRQQKRTKELIRMRKLQGVIDINNPGLSPNQVKRIAKQSEMVKL